MFTFNGRDAHRSLTALRLHLPINAAVAEILPERERTEDDDADSALQRLPAPGLRGTWARAYALLTRLVSQIGWDELLKTRSAVFVMEEEYRMQKAQVDIAAVSREETLADDDASTKGVLTSPSPSENREESPTSSAVQSPTQTHVGDAESVIPTIRISTESAREESLRAEKAAATAKMNGLENAHGDPVIEGLQQPAQAAAGDGDGESKDPTPKGGPGGQESFSFSNKRLCERWLDNLFMVLYEVSVGLRSMECADRALGPPCLDDFSGRSRALQDAACGIPQDWPGMGNPWRPWFTVAPQGGGKRGVPAGVGHGSVFNQAVGKVAGYVRGGRRFDAYAAGGDTRGCVPTRRVLRTCGVFAS
jgi:hypothetical protein